MGRKWISSTYFAHFQKYAMMDLLLRGLFASGSSVKVARRKYCTIIHHSIYFQEHTFKPGLSFRILEKNSSNKKLKENLNSSNLFKKLKNIFQKLNISGKYWFPYVATVTSQQWIFLKTQENFPKTQGNIPKTQFSGIFFCMGCQNKCETTSLL